MLFTYLSFICLFLGMEAIDLMPGKLSAGELRPQPPQPLFLFANYFESVLE